MLQSFRSVTLDAPRRTSGVLAPMVSAIAPEPWAPDARDLLAIARAESSQDRAGRYAPVAYDSVGGQS
jgi:hypothetical protein